MDKMNFFKSLAEIKNPVAAVVIMVLGGVWAVKEISKTNANCINVDEEKKNEFDREFKW